MKAKLQAQTVMEKLPGVDSPYDNDDKEAETHGEEARERRSLTVEWLIVLLIPMVAKTGATKHISEPRTSGSSTRCTKH